MPRITSDMIITTILRTGISVPLGLGSFFCIIFMYFLGIGNPMAEKEGEICSLDSTNDRKLGSQS